MYGFTLWIVLYLQFLLFCFFDNMKVFAVRHFLLHVRSCCYLQDDLLVWEAFFSGIPVGGEVCIVYDLPISHEIILCYIYAL